MIRVASAGHDSELVWFKSTYSGGNDGESCVEVATTPAFIHVRDSKVTDGPTFHVASAAWADFVTYASDVHHHGQ
ncbi:DUF397 domain-containing protein [Streptomyces soliscabiei]|uniref:DUF397 domain-containing protein n=1 Tax=Streptomyces soliscabiei TaxID=588897 RepID=UPI0029BA147A|nr:DUF397 domain-containing protein [Streptomyces sp. NY05-11A]MDX2675762.1 DUF397 domain-containing protein [Streptomyces sp. NY05-11A]